MRYNPGTVVHELIWCGINKTQHIFLKVLTVAGLEWPGAGGSFNHGMTISALYIASRWDAIVR